MSGTEKDGEENIPPDVETENYSALKNAEVGNSSAFLPETEADGDDEGSPGTLTRQVGAATKFIDDYKEPTKEDIKAYIRKNHLRNAQDKKYSFCATRAGYASFIRTPSTKPGSGSDAVRRLGPGVSSYFYFLRCYSLIFILFGIVSLPALFLNFEVGNALRGLPVFSVGNLLQEEDIFNIQQNAETYTVELFGQVVEFDRVIVGYVNVGTDILIVLLFLFFAEYVLLFFKRKEIEWDKDYPKLEHYTLEVTNLPLKATYEDIKEHFTALVEDIVHPTLVDGSIKRRRRGGSFTLTEAPPRPGGKDTISDVQVVSTTKDKLTFAINMANYSRAAEKLKAKFALAQKKRDKGKISETRFRLIARSYDRAVDRLKAYWDKNLKIKANVEAQKTLKAFVTFSRVYDRDAVLEAYEKRKNYVFKNCSSTDPVLKMGGRIPKVKPASPPALVKWEHMEYKRSFRRCRVCISYLTILLVLFVSVISLFVVTKAEEIDIFSELTPEQQEAADPFVGSNAACQNFALDLSSQASNELSVIEDFQELNCDIEEIDATTPDDCVIAFTCICVVSADPSVLEDPVCAQLFFSQLLNNALQLVTAILVTIFNIILELLIEWTVLFERDEDRSKAESKLFLRLFFASYVNTALVKLVADISLESVLGFPIPIPIFEDGEFTDFTADWYSSVGFDICIIALTNIPGPHIFSLLEYWYAGCRRRFFKPLSMADIENHYLGPQFLLPIRYAQACVTIYFTLTYSPGMPILYPIGALALYVTFMVDKYLLLKFYRKPPLYTNEIAVRVCRGMKYGILLHVAFAIIMFSEPTLFPVDDAGLNILGQALDEAGVDNNATNFLETPFFQRVFNLPVIFLTVLFLLLVVYHLTKSIDIFFYYFRRCIFKIFFGTLKCFFYVITCGGCCGSSSDRTVEDLTKLEAERLRTILNAEKLVGISSYNILANPQYAKRFKLKDNKSFNLVLREEKPHSTAEVMRLLDRGESLKAARLVFENAPSSNRGLFPPVFTSRRTNRTNTTGPDMEGGDTLPRGSPKASTTKTTRSRWRRGKKKNDSTVPPSSPDGRLSTEKSQPVFEVVNPSITEEVPINRASVESDQNRSSPVILPPSPRIGEKDVDGTTTEI